jgi:hypothetical protein
VGWDSLRGPTASRPRVDVVPALLVFLRDAPCFSVRGRASRVDLRADRPRLLSSISGFLWDDARPDLYALARRVFFYFYGRVAGPDCAVKIRLSRSELLTLLPSVNSD